MRPLFLGLVRRAFRSRKAHARPSAPDCWAYRLATVYSHFDADDVAEDYRQLLRRASVTRRLALSQHAAWERDIRAMAAADELKIRTWSRDGAPATVWAVLPDWQPTYDEQVSFNRRISWLHEE
jgi:hypothetical protein